MRTSLDISELAQPPSSYYTLFGYCTATYSWHSSRGPCLLIPMTYSWPGLGCLLHVRSTPWLTGSSFRSGVQRVCSCRHNKWAARLPLTALFTGGSQGIYEWEQRGVWRSAVYPATVKQQLGERGSLLGSELNSRESQHPDWHRKLQQSGEARGVVTEEKGGVVYCPSVSLGPDICRCRKLEVFHAVTYVTYFLWCYKRKKLGGFNPIQWQFIVSILVDHARTHTHKHIQVNLHFFLQDKGPLQRSSIWQC